MPFHLAMYSESLGQVTDSDTDAAADDVFERTGNTRLRFSQPMQIIAAWASGTTLTRMNFANSSLTIRGRPNIWPIDRSATPADPPNVMDLRAHPIKLPLHEELQVNSTTDAVGPARVELALWLTPRPWQPKPVTGERVGVCRATSTTTGGGAGAWSNAIALAFDRELFTGVYAVVGGAVFIAAAQAFRIRFPVTPEIQGKQYRPGGLTQNALDTNPNRMQLSELGEWGRFHTSELPSLQTFGAAGASEVRLDLMYLGDDFSLLRA